MMRKAFLRRFWFAATLALACMVGGVAISAHRVLQGAPPRRFAVQEIQTLLLGRARARWAGQALLVRGSATTCADGGLACPSMALDLPTIAYIGSPSSSGVLRVALSEPADPNWLAALRAMPMIGRFVPDPGSDGTSLPPEQGAMGRVGTFRIRLLAGPRCSRVQVYICYDGVLLDATPN